MLICSFCLLIEVQLKWNNFFFSVEWHKTGGVLLMGYEMYRLMTSRKGHIAQPKKPGRKAAGKEMVIDVDEEDKTKDMFIGKIIRWILFPHPFSYA